MKYLPKEKDRSFAYKLFHYPYLWSYADNENYDVNDTEFFGRVSTGDLEMDTRLATAKCERYLTTNRAAELAASGVAMALIDQKDAVLIYNLITGHLHDWLNYLTREGAFSRHKQVPLQGLKEFNLLAKSLVKVARRNGLVDSKDKYKQNRARRGIMLGYTPVIDLAKVDHSDEVMNQITAIVRKGSKR